MAGDNFELSEREPQESPKNRLSFSDIDESGDGQLSKHELRKFLPNDDALSDDFERHDINKDGKLNRAEYRQFLQRRAYTFAERMVLPKKARHAIDEVDGAYHDEMTCRPPPIFMFAITLIEIGIFGYYTHLLVKKYGWIGLNGPAPTDSVLIYDPYRRHEAWRFLTYMLVHSGWVHITGNVVMQLFLGILLEMVHKWYRVLPVYFAGVIAGSLATSLTDPTVFLCGASGGVYALITAHLATVILNWKDMEFAWFRLIAFTSYIILDVAVALYYRYFDEMDQKIGYVAHFGGGLAGLCVGVFVLRNLTPEKWEKIVSWILFATFIVLVIVCIGVNIFYTSHFPGPRKSLKMDPAFLDSNNNEM